MYSILETCRSGSAFVAEPEKGRSVDVPRLLERLAGLGHVVVLDAGVMHLLRSPKGIEYSLYSSGKVLVKCGERVSAEGIIEDIETASMD